MATLNASDPALAAKHPDQSVVTMTELLLPSHANTLGTAFGGQILSWVDIAASICATRHSGTDTVTVSFDDVHFKVPIHVGDVVVIEARMAMVGSTSMEIEVDVWRETRVAPREKALVAYVTFVSLGSDGKPARVPELTVDNDADRARLQAAKTRRTARLERARRV